MTGLVLVSHSRALARAAAELASEVGRQENLTLPIAFAGGAGENHAFLGTDATDIMNAVTSVYSPDGVLVLMDMGSSVISARLAAELLGEGYNLKLSSAPLVEGAIVAAVQMKAGSSLDELAKEASAALAAKEQATGGADATESPPVAVPLDGALSFRFRIGLEHGLHTRPQAALVGIASKFQSQIFLKNITKNKPPVNAKSMNKLSVYSVAFGDEAEILVLGADEGKAFAAIKGLVKEHFSPLEDGSIAPAPLVLVKEKPLPRLRAISGGVARGKAYCADTTRSVPEKRDVADPRKEVLRFELALKAAEKRIRGFKANLLRMGLKSEAAIFDAHVLILYDEELLNEVKRNILNQGLCAEYLYMRKMRALSEELSSLPDTYMRERAADIEDVAGQALIALTGGGEQADAEDGEIILIAREVSPALLGRWGAGVLKGVIMEEGGESSHAAIIARAIGIPCVSGYPMPSRDMTGVLAILDADALKVIIPAEEKDIESYRAKEEKWKALRLMEEKERFGEAFTLDNVKIEVLANAGNVVEAKTALENGAAGIGLLRSEFLFLSKKEKPTEDEQTALLREIFAAYGEKPVTVRTIDIGGDKHCEWLNLPDEKNPFLGVRGIRLCYREKEFFKTQIRAILKAGAGFNAKIMVPMVSVTEEIEFAKSVLMDAHEELKREGAEHLWPVSLGIMIETPAAVFMAREFASMVDFFSIGTNDLGQYIMCAERGNEFDFDLTGEFQPAKLKAVKLVVEEAKKAGIPVSVCGEMAGQPGTARALLALGVRSLSLGSAGLGRVKRMIRNTSLKELEKLAEDALSAKNSSAAKKLFK